MSVSLSPVGGAGWQFFDNNGVPLAGGKLYAYDAGTSTPKSTFTSSDGLTAHTNPIVLDAAGRIPNGGEIWLTTGNRYKLALKTSLDAQVWVVDNVTGISGAQIVENFTGTGAQTVYTLTNPPFSENTTQIFINGVYQQKNTYSLTSTTLTFSQAPPDTSTIEISYT